MGGTNKSDPRKVYNKALRDSRREIFSYPSRLRLEAHLDLKKKEHNSSQRKKTKKTGRAQMNGKCASKLDYGVIDESPDLNDFDEQNDIVERASGVTISLLEIAQPVRARGADEEFEVLRKVTDVVVLDEDFAESECWDSLEDLSESECWEDWEDLHVETKPKRQKRLYSEVVRDIDNPKT